MLLYVGCVMLVIATFALIGTLAMVANEQGQRTVGSFIVNWFANGVYGLGLVLILAGSIVRAIWFLPGEDRKPSR